MFEFKPPKANRDHNETLDDPEVTEILKLKKIYTRCSQSTLYQDKFVVNLKTYLNFVTLTLKLPSEGKNQGFILL